MTESIYDKIENRISKLNKIKNGFFKKGKNEVFTGNDYIQFCDGVVSHESPRYTLEFDKFIRKYPVKYLNTILEQYIELDSEFEHLLSWPTDPLVKYNIELKSQCIKQIIEYLKGMLSPENIKETEHEPEIFLDYSDNSQAERIVFLHELGILEYLQHKMNKELHGFSANKLAEIISTFTGIEQSTAQPYLNPIFTKDAIQKNNPLTKINLEKVKNKLKNIGFNTSKSA